MKPGPAARLAAALSLISAGAGSVAATPHPAGAAPHTESAARAQPSQAPDPWSLYPRIGLCGLTRGNPNHVRFWQTILWADGQLSGTGAGAIDGIFGDVSLVGTVGWQDQHKVAERDGCARQPSLDHAYYGHLEFVRRICPGAAIDCDSQYMYDGSSKNIRIDWERFIGPIACFHWHVYQPQSFDVGCPA
jgi:hypothetical protein